MINAGNLNRRITIQSPPTAKNSFGEIDKNDSWTSVATVWAKHEYISGGEAFSAQQKGITSKEYFIIRYRTDVQPTWRIVFENKNYDIQRIEKMGRNDQEELKIYVEYREVGEP